MRAYSDEEWARVRERGRLRYVLGHALVQRGLPFGILAALAIEYLLGEKLPGALWHLAFLGRLVLAVGVFTLSGCVWANANWRIHERHYGHKA
jgi:hypothetical protein